MFLPVAPDPEARISIVSYVMVFFGFLTREALEEVDDGREACRLVGAV